MASYFWPNGDTHVPLVTFVSVALPILLFKLISPSASTHIKLILLLK